MESKVCVITGASAGIGVGIAEAMCKIGCKKLVLVARRKEKLDQVAEKCRALGAEKVLCLSKDLGDLEQCPQVVDETLAKFGRLDILINNAAILNRVPTTEMKTEDFQNIMHFNVTSPFVLTKAAVPHIRKVKGNIVFMSSLGAHITGAGLAAYSTSKAALTMFSKVVAIEEAKNGVRVNVVSPAGVLTEMLQTYFDPKMTMDEVKKEMMAANPLGYCALPSDIGQGVAFLANDATAGYATGTDLILDGGVNLTSEIQNH